MAQKAKSKDSKKEALTKETEQMKRNMPKKDTTENKSSEN